MPGLFKPLSAFVSSSGSKIKPAFKLRISDIVYVLKKNLFFIVPLLRVLALFFAVCAAQEEATTFLDLSLV